MGWGQYRAGPRPRGSERPLGSSRATEPRRPGDWASLEKRFIIGQGATPRSEKTDIPFNEGGGLKSFWKILIVTGLLGLEAACVSASCGPGTVEPTSNSAGGPGDNFTNTGIVPPGDGQAAAPSWTASSSGSVGCLAGS